ncbi:hypothetical protein HYH03_017925 [Edaphochlamys debaryana]|uniref:Uncharacterized protein n=1 Tax=Edaphochlamys debaryana TaxID=47281 RepID=A0A836BNM9_9CHLO|nr:hypothetical protein HYH03_017925 [Edaphochlamys debaryana]|eukprot:KAG2483190.1 hypothetical protein HYH03_017925 [Edaphochlamys debaryana]
MPRANQTDAKDAGNLSDSLWGIERRVQAVDSVIRYLDSKEAAGDLTYEEYEIILEALLEGSSGHVPPTTVTLLQDEKTSLGSVKAAYERHTAQDYGHVMAAGGGGGSAAIGAITNAQARKESSRKHFENRFSQLFERHASARGPGGSFGASLRAVIDTLPEHCVRDVDAAARLHWLGWALLAAQLGGGWAALTAFVHVARKEE